MKRKLTLIISLGIAAVFLIPAFSDSNEALSDGNINTVAMIKTIGFDDDNSFTFCENVITADDNFTSQKAKTSKGESYAEAYVKAQTLSEHQVAFSYAQSFIIGEETAKKGIFNEIDFICRANETRFGANIFICKGTAEAFIREASEFKAELDEILENLEIAGEETGYYHQVSLLDASKAIAEKRSFVIPIIQSDKSGSVKFEGYGVMEGGSLKGIFNRSQSRALNIINGSIKQTVIELPGASLVLKDFSVKKLSQIEENKLKSISVNIRFSSRLKALKTAERVDEKLIEKLKTEGEKALLDEVNSAVETICRYDAANFKRLAERQFLSDKIEASFGEYSVNIYTENINLGTNDLVGKR